ncbi:YlmC/YmxH family sporulation protein [Sedimentibacter sp. MB31-C6]|uniref:YlmC/YmxH family sporulation protein n=1 Tax=Sedimentibacter sp. MB31-C6 TaxID=3109366 RepID=UPI002DDD1736|nr:YlmC/YmxH family sporulation protein [Sedimentibacter sp. MB36-C1]WSI04254.1 YlmC/YmxH family sporulation protein [Sedimentibacter sp. MB36-C1]
MKLSELYSKEIINIDTGENMGIFGDCDLVIDEKTGSIISFISGSSNRFNFFKEQKKKEISWKSIKKIGSDMIIIENE